MASHEALVVLAHERDAFRRPVRLLVVDGAQPRVDLFQHVVAGTRGFDAPLPEVARRRRRHAVARLPAQQRAVAAVLLEQVAEEGRARTEHPDHDERRIDALVGDVGVLSRPVDDAQPIGERAHDVALYCRGAEVVQLRFGRDRRAVHRETLAEAVAAEVVEPGQAARLGDHVVGNQLHQAAEL